MDIHYQRVCPRDLFNEAKLLKCMGLLCLKILDGLAPYDLKYDDEDIEGFNVGLMDEGYLTITNLPFTLNGREIQFCTTYNSKSNYPLFAYVDYEEIPVFDEIGELTPEFISFTQKVKS